MCAIVKEMSDPGSAGSCYTECSTYGTHGNSMCEDKQLRSFLL